MMPRNVTVSAGSRSTSTHKYRRRRSSLVAYWPILLKKSSPPLGAIFNLGIGYAAHEKGGLAALSRHRPRQFPALGKRFPQTRPRQTDARDLGRQGPLYL